LGAGFLRFWSLQDFKLLSPKIGFADTPVAGLQQARQLLQAKGEPTVCSRY
jgi:hypothetical protein